MITVFRQPRTAEETTNIVREQLGAADEQWENRVTTRGCDYRYRNLSDTEVLSAANNDVNRFGATLSITIIALFMFALALNASGFLVAYGIAAILALMLLLAMAWGIATPLFPDKNSVQMLPFAAFLPTVREANARLRNQQ